MGDDWRIGTWVCVGCGTELSQRFHVPTDGHPSDAPPPDGWRVDETGDLLCSSCSAARRTTPPPDSCLTEAYEDCVDEESSIDRWSQVHICLGCIHVSVCRYAPPDDRLLVAISHCRAYEPPDGAPDDVSSSEPSVG